VHIEGLCASDSKYHRNHQVHDSSGNGYESGSDERDFYDFFGFIDSIIIPAGKLHEHTGIDECSDSSES